MVGCSLDAVRVSTSAVRISTSGSEGGSFSSYAPPRRRFSTSTWHRWLTVNVASLAHRRRQCSCMTVGASSTPFVLAWYCVGWMLPTGDNGWMRLMTRYWPWAPVPLRSCLRGRRGRFTIQAPSSTSSCSRLLLFVLSSVLLLVICCLHAFHVGVYVTPCAVMAPP